MHPILSAGIPFFHLGSLGPIQSFGVILVIGILAGAWLLRRYAEWHGVKDEHIRGLLVWITVSGFLGAHLFDVVAYQWSRVEEDPLLLVKVWDGISSYGGFLGGTIGWLIYLRRKKLPVPLHADIAIIGLLPAFSIGRLGCTVVSDHIGAAVDRAQWYAALAMEYPTKTNIEGIQKAIHELVKHHPATGDTILAWNLGLVELLYLIPVNLLILWLAFRPARRLPAGLIAALTGLLYAPVRFFMDYLRPEHSDPRHLGFTFAQWCSIAALAVSAIVVVRLALRGKPAETIAPTPAEAEKIMAPQRADAPKRKGPPSPKVAGAASAADEASSEPRPRQKPPGKGGAKGGKSRKRK